MAEQNPFDEVFGGVSFTPSVSAAQLRRAAERRRVRRRWLVVAGVTALALMLSAGGFLLVKHLMLRQQQHGGPSPWGSASPSVISPRTPHSPTPSEPRTPPPSPSGLPTIYPTPGDVSPTPTGPATIEAPVGLTPGILPDPTELGWPMEKLGNLHLGRLAADSYFLGCPAVGARLAGQASIWWRPPGERPSVMQGDATSFMAVAVSTPNGPALARNLVDSLRGCPVDGLSAPSDITYSDADGTTVTRWSRQGSGAGSMTATRGVAVMHSNDAVVISVADMVKDSKLTETEVGRGWASHLKSVAANLRAPSFDVPATPGVLSAATLPLPAELPGGEKRWTQWWAGEGNPQAVIGECDVVRLLDRADRKFYFTGTIRQSDPEAGEVSVWGVSPEAPDINWKTVRENAKDCKFRVDPNVGSVAVVSLEDHTFSGKPAFIGIYDTDSGSGELRREMWGAVNLGDRIVAVHASNPLPDGPALIRTTLEAIARNDSQ